MNEQSNAGSPETGPKNAGSNRPPAEIYACLHAREFPAQALLRMRPEMRQKPCVVMEGELPFVFVCSLNVRARRLGAAPGMTRVEIETLPSVVALPRSPSEEAAAKAALLECAGEFSPRIEDCGRDGAFVCVAGIEGTEKLFGPPAALVKKLLERVKALGIAASVAVSSNFHTALCVARARSSPNTVTVIEPGHEGAALHSLPLGSLDLTEEQAETFALWGIHTLGRLAALPEKALISRLGQEGKRLRQLARGEMPHLFLPVEPPFALEERMEMDAPVELLDSLLFVIGAMLEQLIARAAARTLALASVTLTLFLEGGASHARTVRPALPSNDRQLWTKLLHLDLQAHPPSAAILSLTLQAEPGSAGKVQLGLFSPQLPEAGRLDVTLARIRAIVGEESAGSAVLKDTHRPEGFGMAAFIVPAASASETATASLRMPPRAAMRRLHPVEPVTVMVRENRPQFFFFRERRYRVERAYGPWAASGEWWSPTFWSFQQWDLVARSEDGALLCCRLTHSPGQEASHDCWQMAGFYD
jgi:protein ImuB